jgi:nucleoside 2-deoxyribosyltransferase
MRKIYLAIPYTGMEQSSYEQVTSATAQIINSYELNVFSPITHSHPLTKYGVKGTWDYWQRIDFQFIDWCDEVWVLIPKEGVDRVKNSIGVQSEIEYATNLGKPVKYIKIQTTVQEYNI